MQIDIDFDVFKALTALRKSEEHSYNDVLRELLQLEDKGNYKLSSQDIAGNAPVLSAPRLYVGKAMLIRGLLLPHGTDLRATYKGKLFQARIIDGVWTDETGAKFGSPSAAATAITDTTVNGWRFWEAKRPGDTEWRKLDRLN